MSSRRPDVLEQLVREAIRLGADTLEVEYSNGCEEVVAYMGTVGRDIGRLGSGTEATALRSALYASTTRPRRLSVAGHEYVIRARLYDTFGEDAFRINLGRSKRMKLTSGRLARRERPLAAYARCYASVREQ